MNFLQDIYTFIKCLSFVDITFFIAIITLLILIVTLIYFIKINKDEPFDENDFFPPMGNNKDEDNKKEEMVNKIDNTEIKETEENSNTEEEFAYNDEEGELLDLEGLTKKLQEDKLNGNMSFDSYEKDQEEKAIISYDELLQKQNKYAINYEKEELLDDLVVKKVNLNDLVNKDEPVKIKEVRVISYEKEEAFLNALKELNKLLN